MKLKTAVTNLWTSTRLSCAGQPRLTLMALQNDLPHRQRLLSAWATDRTGQLETFQKELARSKRIVVLTGAGISAESGIPTFRGAGGFWGKYSATELATFGAFVRDPSLVWRFYEYRRATVLQNKPNRVRKREISRLEENEEITEF